jgi:mRNA-degrading endonuclease RelE of RelBE toxin-antitoxin system
MAARFSVRTTPRFDRFAKALSRRNKEFIARYREAIAILADDPYNYGRAHRIKKLVAARPGEGQWRLRLGRWRFRYDIEAGEVVLQVCGLRDESTYR